jgi:hypothetical protein
MAGTCTGYGIRVNDDNEIEAFVDRVEEWPFTAASVLTKNGTRVDPVTHQLWTPPDPDVNVAEATGPEDTFTPDNTDSIDLGTISLQVTASPDHPHTLFGFLLLGGYQGYRMGAGNFWGVYRHITTYTNGTPITFSDWQAMGGHENNAGASSGSGGPVESFAGFTEKVPATVFKVSAKYELRPLVFTAGATNGFAWRPPRLQILSWTLPV